MHCELLIQRTVQHTNIHENGVEATLIAVEASASTNNNHSHDQQKGFLIHVHLNRTTLIRPARQATANYIRTHEHRTSCTTRYFNQLLCYIHPLKWIQVQIKKQERMNQSLFFSTGNKKMHREKPVFVLEYKRPFIYDFFTLSLSLSMFLIGLFLTMMMRFFFLLPLVALKSIQIAGIIYVCRYTKHSLHSIVKMKSILYEIYCNLGQQHIFLCSQPNEYSYTEMCIKKQSIKNTHD